jgi:hypothetical protein
MIAFDPREQLPSMGLYYDLQGRLVMLELAKNLNEEKS